MGEKCRMGHYLLSVMFAHQNNDINFLMSVILPCVFFFTARPSARSQIRYGQARILCNFLLILMYLHFVPRPHELRTVILDEGVPPGEVVAIGPNRENVIAFYKDGAIELLVTKYKIDQCYGPSKVTVPYDSSMHYYLKLYVSKFRDKLLMGADHPFLLVNARG